MLSAFIAEKVYHLRRILRNTRTDFGFTVNYAHRIFFKTCFAGIAKLVLVLFKVFFKPFVICFFAVRAADTVKIKL